MAKEKIGWIGLGNIGLPMAKRLVGAGFEVIVCGHVRRQPVEEMKAMGAREVANPKEVAGASSIIFSMVRDVPQTEEVLFGPKGVWEGAKRGSTLVLSSTLAPDFCQELEGKGKQRGLQVIDAPVSGGARAAEAGTLTFFAGGDKRVLRKCRPPLEAMGKNIFHLGGVGTGQVAKLSNNLMLMASILATSEGIALAEKAGLNYDVLLETIKVSSGNSWSVQNYDYLAILAKEGSMGLLYKDLGLILEFASHAGLRLPLAGLASQLELPPFPPPKEK